MREHVGHRASRSLEGWLQGRTMLQHYSQQQHGLLPGVSSLHTIARGERPVARVNVLNKRPTARCPTNPGNYLSQILTPTLTLITGLLLPERASLRRHAARLAARRVQRNCGAAYGGGCRRVLILLNSHPSRCGRCRRGKSLGLRAAVHAQARRRWRHRARHQRHRRACERRGPRELCLSW